ncbi:diguanylate cyclase [Gracilibacillus oryzae]|uniref:Diguanylate cyclase n=1 Tax=Gracilibacillus oryzae TaxID=1672701 RepID=A0A7C8KQA5_9BACI|nr:diguanylate cyclase [Gracilibacillus oryzae]KAB8136742.1 diguanylate cyclase [Gracilibacillus oryzae]
MNILFYFILYIIPASLFIFMAGMIYANNRYSRMHKTCSLLYIFASLWFFGVFTALITFPQSINEIIIYWINGSITVTSLLSVHLWFMTAGMYEKKNGKFLKLAFIPGVLLILMLPIESWMVENPLTSQNKTFIPGPGLYLLWIVDFLYLLINFVIIIVEMRRGRSAARLWFIGHLLFFVWTIIMLTAALTFQDVYIFFYLIPYGSLFWAIAIYLSMTRFDYLSSYEKRYHILFKRSPLGILLLDKDAKVVEASPQVPQYLGVKREELVHSPIVSLLDGINKQTYMKEHQKVFEKNRKLVNVELSFENRLKERKTLLVDSEFITVNGKKLLFVMAKDITEAKVKAEKVQYLAYHDVLTGLSNRAAFEKKITELLNKNAKFNFLLLDLNKLKQINDTFGHQAGDYAIQHVAKVIQTAVNEDDHTARLGGDEFVLLLDLEETNEIVNKIEKQLAVPLQLPDNEQITLSASIGISSYPADGETLEQLYSIADKRMYRQKRQEDKPSIKKRY